MPRRSFAAGISAEALARAGVEVLPPLERELQADIVQALRQLGWSVWELQLGSAGNGAVYGTKGLPDLYVFKPGRGAVWLELKRPKTGRVSPAQHERHAELRSAQIPIHVVRSLDEALGLLT